MFECAYLCPGFWLLMVDLGATKIKGIGPLMGGETYPKIFFSMKEEINT